MSPESKKLFTDALIFRHRPAVGRVVFIASPLKGSDLATNWIGRISSSLARSPIALLDQVTPRAAWQRARRTCHPTPAV